ncbi:MAG TPA: PD-(D/E)XK nuclease family protein [Vicinamibacterales bacterium]
MEAVIGRAASERLAAAEAFVSQWGASAEIVVLGATREAADDFCRGVTLRRGATFGLHRFTLGQFAARVAGGSLAARDVALASGLGAEAIAARAIFETARVGGLRYLAPVADAPGLPRAVAATLGELREAGVPPGRLAAESAAGPDLARLADEYERQLDLARAADRAVLLREAARLVRERAPEALTGLPVLALDVRIGSAAERDLLAALGETSPALLLTVPDGDERTLALLPHGTVRRNLPGDTAAVSSSALARLRTHLFSGTAEPGTFGDDVSFFSAPGEGREAVEVTRRVLEEAARGVPFDEIAIVVRAPELYWSPLEQALARAKVPAWYSRGTRRPDPTGRAFLALLACRAEGLSARRFGEYLSLGQVPPRDHAGAPAPEPTPVVVPRDETLGAGQLSLLDLIERATAPAASGQASRERNAASAAGGDAPPEEDLPASVRTPWRWEGLLVEAAVVGGVERWRRRLDGLAEELALQQREEESEEPGSPRAAALARDIEALEDLRRFALPIIEDLDALPESALWGEWLDRLEALAPRALRHPARVLELLADLRPMAAVGPVSLAEVRRVLVPRLTLLERDPPKLRFGRVFVCTPEQLRGRAFRTVFVLGLAERIFPQRSRQDPLLLDPARGRLDPTLVTEPGRVQAERLLLRLAAGAATERLLVSYPRLDVAQARARVPSFYALDIVRALTGAVPNYEEFERQTAKDTGAWLAWPAPEDPAVAIDDWEHDLAVLGRLLDPRAERRAVKGAAHYLLTLNEALARSLRTRWARWKTRWSTWDGLVGQVEAVKGLLASQRLTARAYSVSALQRFAACPYQFLLGAIYRFAPLERPEALVQLDPLTRGALFHEIQRDVLRSLSAHGLLPIPRDRREEALRLLDEACAAAFDRYHERLAPAIERVWQDETELLQADLRMWLQQLAANEEWVPRYFELSFGLPLDPSHDAASVPDPVRLDGRFPIRGAIDLIEEHAVFGHLRVTDHKTGRNRTTPSLVVGGGSTLQPVIYGLVAEQIFGRHVVHARLSFATTAGGFTEHVVSLREDARRAGIEVLEIIDRAIEAGSLPPAPRPGACAWCDFRAVCGPLEETRFAHKRRDLPSLEDLMELRRMR